MASHRQLLIRLVLGAVVFHLLAMAVGLWNFVGIGPQNRPDLNLAPAELMLLGLGCIGAAPLLLLRGERSPVETGPLSAGQLAAWVGLHLFLVCALGFLVTDWAPFLDDEHVYLFQAQRLLEGGVDMPADALGAAATGNRFFIFREDAAGVTRWAGCYPFMAGLVTAPGALVGWPNLMWVPVGGLMVWHATRLAETLAPEAPRHLVPLLMATSPALICLCVMKHTSALAALFSVLAARALVARNTKGDLALGAMVGLTVLSRPVDGLLLGVLASVMLLRQRDPAESQREALRWVRVGAGGLPFLVVLLAYNHAVTGDFTKMPYAELFGGRPVYGFGITAYGEHTLGQATHFLTTNSVRFALWGLPLPLAFWVILDALRGDATKRARTLPIVALALAHFALYFPAPFGQYSPIGVSYGIWLLPVLAVLCARLGELDGRWFERAAALTLLTWCTLVPYGLKMVADRHARDEAPMQRARELADQHGKILLVHRGFKAEPSKNFRYQPPPTTSLDEDIIWFYTAGDPQRRAEALEAFPDRPAFRIGWGKNPDTELLVQRLR